MKGRFGLRGARRVERLDTARGNPAAPRFTPD
jgi:hypothetical protein